MNLPLNVFGNSFEMVPNWAMTSTTNVLYDLSCMFSKLLFGTMNSSSLLYEVQRFVSSGKTKLRGTEQSGYGNASWKLIGLWNLLESFEMFPKRLWLTLMASFDWFFFEIFMFWSRNKFEFCLWIVSWNSLVIDLILSSMNVLASISANSKIFTNLSVASSYTFPELKLYTSSHSRYTLNELK